jgi:hypothetical protein
VTSPERVLYCHCRYADVVPREVKTDVLAGLAASGRPFDAVPDLCEMSARRDPKLVELAAGPVRIAACYPRAVRWLFAAAGAPLPDGAEVLNMRVEPAEAVLDALAGSHPEPAEPA